MLVNNYNSSKTGRRKMIVCNRTKFSRTDDVVHRYQLVKVLNRMKRRMLINLSKIYFYES